MKELNNSRNVFLEKTLHGQTIGSWARLLSTGTDAVISRALQTQFDIKDVDITEIIE